MTKFVKADAGKLRLDLLPPEALLALGRGLTHGALKYSADNWRRCRDPRRYVAALLRHLVADMAGERVDPDSQLAHLDLAICNLAFIVAFRDKEQLRGKANQPRRRTPRLPRRAQ